MSSSLQKYNELKEYLTEYSKDELIAYMLEQDPDIIDIIERFMEETRPDVWNEDDDFEQNVRGM